MICRGGVKLESEIIVPEEQQQQQKPKSKNAKASEREEGLQNKSSIPNFSRRHFVRAAHEKRKETR